MTSLRHRLAATTMLAVAVALPPDARAAHGGMPTETKPFHHQSDPAEPWFVQADRQEPVLFDTLGTLTFPITAANAEVQEWFDQGLRWAYGFNHYEALRAFRKAQRLDPACAACYWGEALVLGPNINAPMSPGANAVALAAIRKAEQHAPQAGEKERALIAALARRYAEAPDADRAALNEAYADAMTEVRSRFPDDPDIATLHAASIMNLAPWDYWADGGRTPKGRASEAIESLERGLAARPDHPGLIHYYIHLVEASDRPERAEPYADHLSGLVPGAGHLEHMPSHIYFRVGRWLDSLEVNHAAAAADEAYLAATDAVGIYPNAYYPHVVHYLMTSAQMAGDGRTAIASAEKLGRIVTEAATREVPWVQPIAQAPYFAHAQFSEPATVLALPDPGDTFPFVKAAWHYARGIALVAQGDTAAAAGEADAIAYIADTADLTGLIDAGISAAEVLQVAHAVVEGTIARRDGDLAAAEAAFRRAVAAQDAMLYMEPPYWYYPVRQSLGAVLLQDGRPDEARAVFEETLARVPNNGWALYGLMKAYEAMGDEAAAKEAASRFVATWAGPPDGIALDRL